MPRVPANPPPATAFTLMELMVVLALIAILSALIIPEMRGSFEDALLRSSSRQFIDVFSRANSRAVSLNQTHRVRLDRAAGRYVLERQLGHSSRAAAFVPIREISGDEGTIDHRIAMELRFPAPTPPAAGPKPSAARSLEAISFYPDGTADGAELILQDRAGVRLALRLNPVTARVAVTELPRP